MIWLSVHSYKLILPVFKIVIWSPRLFHFSARYMGSIYGPKTIGLITYPWALLQ